MLVTRSTSLWDQAWRVCHGVEQNASHVPTERGVAQTVAHRSVRAVTAHGITHLVGWWPESVTLCVIRMPVPQSDVQVRGDTADPVLVRYLQDVSLPRDFFSPPHPHFDWAEVQSPVLLGLPVDS